MKASKGIFGICIILLLFMAAHLGFSTPVAAGQQATASTLIGGLAFLLMTSSIFLATRPQFLEDTFGGLDRMYQVHKACGISAGSLILLHFFSAPKSVPVGFDAETISLFPSLPLGMLALVSLILSLALTLNRKVPYHRWRIAHKAMGLVYIIAIIHLMTVPSIFFERFGLSGIMLLIAASVGVLSYFYTVLGFNRHTSFPYVIESVNQLERAVEIELRPKADAMHFKAGQFAFIEIQDQGLQEPHPFSISSSPNDETIRFTIRVLGDWTRKIREELKSGTEAILRGPYGRFESDFSEKKQVWMAGGIGITPFLSMVRGMGLDDDRDIHLVYAVREKKEALFLDEISSKVSQLTGFKLVLLESKLGDYARVDIMKTKLPAPISEYDYYLCGPKSMVNGISNDLRKEGIVRSRIHTEAFEFR